MDETRYSSDIGTGQVVRILILRGDGAAAKYSRGCCNDGEDPGTIMEILGHMGKLQML